MPRPHVPIDIGRDDIGRDCAGVVVPGTALQKTAAKDAAVMGKRPVLESERLVRRISQKHSLMATRVSTFALSTELVKAVIVQPTLRQK